MKRGTICAVLAAAALGGTAFGQVGAAYLFNMRGAKSLSTIPVATGTPRTIISTTYPTFSSYGIDFSTDANTLYALNVFVVGIPTLGTLNLSTGAFTLIAPVTGVTPAVDPVDLCIGPNGTAYYVGGTGDSNLYTINLATGVCTLVAPITGANLLVDVAIDVNGLMYGHDIGTDNLVRVDTATGVVTPVGPHGLLANFAQGMDFDWSTNILYATIYTGGGTGRYVSWDTSTGAVTTILDTFVFSPNSEFEIAIRQPAPSGPGCDPDFNCDGNPDQDDVACLINVVAGNPGCQCQDADFNGDGNVDQDDVGALINVVAGGECP